MIIPEKVNMLALIGIVIPGVYNIVVKRLSMKDPIVVGLSPNCDNIKYILPSALQ